jgi:hypothetical protein
LLKIFHPRQRGGGVEDASVSHRVNNGVGVSEVPLGKEDADGVRGFAAELGWGEDGLFVFYDGGIDDRRDMCRSKLFGEEGGYDLG